MGCLSSKYTNKASHDPPDRRQQQTSSSSPAGQAPEQSSDSIGALATRMGAARIRNPPQAPPTGSAGLQPHQTPAASQEEDQQTVRSATMPRERSQDLPGGSAGSHIPRTPTVQREGRSPATTPRERSQDRPSGSAGSHIPRTPTVQREGRSPATTPSEHSQDHPSSSAGSHIPRAAIAQREGRLPASVAVSTRQRTINPPPREDRSPSGQRQLTGIPAPGRARPERSLHSTVENRSTSKERTQHQLSGASSQAPSAGSAEPQVPRRHGGEESSTSGESMQDHSVAATGTQFFPTASRGRLVLLDFRESVSRGKRSPTCKMGIGIETEFLLAARRSEHERDFLYSFADTIVDRHNICVEKQHPRMTNDLLTLGTRIRFDQWTLVKDESVATENAPWGIEMITPLFVAFAGSRWRRHVEATWRYLRNSYKITDNSDCGTHIHVSVEGGYSLEEIKRVAQATVHFEPAFEALVPEHRTSRYIWTRSSWLGSPDLAAKDLSRAGCIQLIEEASDFPSFLGLMHPDSIGGYSWNFTTINKYYTIEFRKPPASKTVEEALGWAELAMNFVQASLRCESPGKLREFPPTVGGLRRFLQKIEIEGLNEPARLQCIFKDKDANAFALVKPTGINMKKSQMATIERVIAAERSVIEWAIRNKSQEYSW